jgi:hypothetical protein
VSIPKKWRDPAFLTWAAADPRLGCGERNSGRKERNSGREEGLWPWATPRKPSSSAPIQALRWHPGKRLWRRLRQRVGSDRPIAPVIEGRAGSEPNAAANDCPKVGRTLDLRPPNELPRNGEN